MARFCPVAPIQVLEGLKSHDPTTLGQHHLLLTHHTLDNPERFAELFQGHLQSTIVMDNSVVELGDAASDQLVWDACQVFKDVRASNGQNHWLHPVLTDVMSDADATIEAAEASYNWWAEKMQGAHHPYHNLGLMVVLQGNDWDSFAKTANHFLHDHQSKYPKIAIAGIPRVLVGHVGSRERMIKYMDAVYPQVNLHLLGFSDDVADDLIVANHHRSMMIDSAVPLRFEGEWSPTSDIPPRPKDWFETAEVSHQMIDNLNRARRMCA